MRDLYQQLNLEPYADAGKIRAAAERSGVEPQLRADAQGVLLTPRHRRSYDRTHRLLTTVGQLRRRMDLHLRPFWARSGNQDFTATAPSGRNNPLAVAQALDGYPMKPRRRWLQFASIVVSLVVAAMIAWKLKHHAH